MTTIDWKNFVKSVMSDYASGICLDEINEKYHSQSIEGTGEVLNIQLGADEDCRFCCAQLRMQSVQFELRSNGYGNVNFISLIIDPNDVSQWDSVEPNDTIKFSTNINSLDVDSLFPPIAISLSVRCGTRFDLELGTKKSQLVEIVSRANNIVFDVSLYAILPTQMENESYWFFNDRPLNDRERTALRTELIQFGIEEPYEGSIQLGSNCRISVSFLGLDRDPGFSGGHARVYGYHPSVPKLFWRLSRAADLMLDLPCDINIVTYPNRLGDFNKVTETLLASGENNIDFILQSFF